MSFVVGLAMFGATTGNGAGAAGDLPAGGRTAPIADVMDYAEGSIATGG